MIAQDQTRGNSSQVTDMEKSHAKETSSAKQISPLVSVRRESRSPFKRRIPVETSNRNEYGMTEALTEQKIQKTRHKAWIHRKELYKIKRAFPDVHETRFFQGHSPSEEANTSKRKPIRKSKDRLYLVDSEWCFPCT